MVRAWKSSVVKRWSALPEDLVQLSVFMPSEILYSLLACADTCIRRKTKIKKYWIVIHILYIKIHFIFYVM